MTTGRINQIADLLGKLVSMPIPDRLTVRTHSVSHKVTTRFQSADQHLTHKHGLPLTVRVPSAVYKSNVTPS